MFLGIIFVAEINDLFTQQQFQLMFFFAFNYFRY